MRKQRQQAAGSSKEQGEQVKEGEHGEKGELGRNYTFYSVNRGSVCDLFLHLHRHGSLLPCRDFKVV